MKARKKARSALGSYTDKGTAVSSPIRNDNQPTLLVSTSSGGPACAPARSVPFFQKGVIYPKEIKTSVWDVRREYSTSLWNESFRLEIKGTYLTRSGAGSCFNIPYIYDMGGQLIVNFSKVWS